MQTGEPPLEWSKRSTDADAAGLLYGGVDTQAASVELRHSTKDGGIVRQFVLGVRCHDAALGAFEDSDHRRPQLEPPPDPAVLDQFVARNRKHDVRTESPPIDQRERKRTLQPAQRSRREEMQRGSVVVAHRRLCEHVNVVAVALAQT
jgi:hypothetical protein